MWFYIFLYSINSLAVNSHIIISITPKFKFMVKCTEYYSILRHTPYGHTTIYF